MGPVAGVDAAAELDDGPRSLVRGQLQYQVVVDVDQAASDQIVGRQVPILQVTAFGDVVEAGDGQVDGSWSLSRSPFKAEKRQIISESTDNPVMESIHLRDTHHRRLIDLENGINPWIKGVSISKQFRRRPDSTLSKFMD